MSDTPKTDALLEFGVFNPLAEHARNQERRIAQLEALIAAQHCNSVSGGMFTPSPGWTPECDCWKSEVGRLPALSA